MAIAVNRRYHGRRPRLAMKIVLDTERLILREYTEEDAPDLFRLGSDPDVMRYVPDKPMANVDEARETLLSHPIADYQQHGFGRWACIVKATRQNVGFCGLKHLKEMKEVDLGFRFLPAHWGKGLATEAAQASVDYGFRRLALDHIIGLSHPDNQPSIRVLEKVGMQFVDVVRPYGFPMLRYVVRRPAH
jgi:RimJ/RimL family protein N-acetyltransferase